MKKMVFFLMSMVVMRQGLVEAACTHNDMHIGKMCFVRNMDTSSFIRKEVGADGTTKYVCKKCGCLKEDHDNIDQ